MLKLIEEMSGVGELTASGREPQRVRYAVSRYQGMTEGSGMPIPGWHRVEGSVTSDDDLELPGAVGESLTLRLEDGRAICVTLADERGRILTEGHGPGRCCCC
jgi:hypothetical protein